MLTVYGRAGRGATKRRARFAPRQERITVSVGQIVGDSSLRTMLATVLACGPRAPGWVA